MYVCMYVCMYVRMYVCVRLCVYVMQLFRIKIYDLLSFRFLSKHMYVCMYVYTHIHVSMLTYPINDMYELHASSAAATISSTLRM